MERPTVHPQLILDLRQACAIIVNETNPPDPDEEPAHYETLRKFEEERKAKYVAQARAADVKSQKAEIKSARTEQRAYERAQKEHARQLEAEAKRAVAREAELERRKVIERQAELRMGNTAETVKEQPRKEQPRRYSARRPPQDVHLCDSKSEPRAAALMDAAESLEGPMGHGRSAETYRFAMEPLEPTHTKISNKAKGKQKEMDSDRHRQPMENRSITRLELLPPVHATIVTNSRARQIEGQEPILDHIRASLHGRPKTSAAATVDYDEPSGGSSKSSTRSNTDYDHHGRPTSTAVTSAVLTPGDDKRISYHRQPSVNSYRRPSDESDQSGESNVHAKAWQGHERVLRQAEEKYNSSGRAARPGSRASKRSRRWGGDGDSEYERPLSRSGSITESIRSGISHYMRPRASQDSTRSGRSSAAGLSRSHSRSSSTSRSSSNGWWRGGGLRRKGSWSSFRSTRPDQDEPSKLRKNGEPNLNRPLPALPGLDQYKETKTHIGQLMKVGGRGRRKEKNLGPEAPYPLQQQQAPANGHVKKESISGPILRNESMERTLHRYRESQIMQDPPRKTSSSQTRQESPRRTAQQETLFKDSELSVPRSTSRLGQDLPRSQSRNEISLKPTKNRRDSESAATSTKMHKQPPPIIRGPSWHKEIEAGVYPRPMDTSKGPVEVRYENGMFVHDVTTPGAMWVEGASPTKKRSGDGGLKGRVGRMFGGRETRGLDGGGARRVVQRSVTAS